jgi:LAGLIDADG DNA endonuclease family protein
LWVTMRCAVGYLLETPSIRWYSFSVTPSRENVAMSSDNPTGADNQQERLTTIGWLVGFVDGEGCFSVPIFRQRSMSLGWQVQPAFAVVQGASSRDVLEEMVTFFGCGKVYINRRHDNHREHLYRYYVSRFGDLRDVIVPFFQENPLRTAKRDNFAKFAMIIELMDRRRHLTVPGLIEIAEIAQTMNHRKPSEALRILRDHTPTLFAVSSEEDEMARPLWRHREAGGNAQPADSDSPPDRSYK